MFVPAWRKESSKPDSPTTAQHILAELERERYAATRDWRFDSDTNPDRTSTRYFDVDPDPDSSLHLGHPKFYMCRTYVVHIGML